MATLQKVKAGDLLVGRLSHGADLLEELTEICLERNVRLGRIEAIGAVQEARLAFYDQQKKEYRFLEIKKPLEIAKLVGNVSIKDGRPFVHAHITLADERGNAHGGHLAKGTVIFACEFILHPLEGSDLVRQYDPETGLPLWGME